MKSSSVAPTLQQRLAERQRPPGAVVMYQRWENLLFLHWKWDADAIQASLPPGLTVDTFEGSAWLGLVPLYMRDIRPRFVPAVPAISDFLELNVRTYVIDASGRPGVYFYSLDCNQPIAVETARRLLFLRYEHAAIEAALGEDGWVDFECQRKGTEEKSSFRYRPFDVQPFEAAPETLEFFLIERYRLYASDSAGQRLNTIRLCHAPYRIRRAEVSQWGEAALRQAGFNPNGRAPDHVCMTDPVELETFAPEKVE